MELMKGMVLDQWSDPEINMGISKYGFGILYANQHHIGHPMVRHEWIRLTHPHKKEYQLDVTLWTFGPRLNRQYSAYTERTDLVWRMHTWYRLEYK